VKLLDPLFVNEIAPTVIAAARFTVWMACGLLKVALAPTALGTPNGVQFPATFQDCVPVVMLKVWAFAIPEIVITSEAAVATRGAEATPWRLRFWLREAKTEVSQAVAVEAFTGMVESAGSGTRLNVCRVVEQ
jgi:hypothetical protein